MILKSVVASGLFLLSAVSAHAVTIQPGETYQGTYAVSESEIVSFFPVVSIDGPFLIASYGFDSPDFPGFGEYTITHLNSDGSLFAETTYVSDVAGSGFVGGIGVSDCSFCEISPTGFVQVTNNSASAMTLGGSLFPTGVEIQVVVDATVFIEGTGDFPTDLSWYSPVSNFTLVESVIPPAVVPLPASAVLLLAALAGLAGIGRRRLA